MYKCNHCNITIPDDQTEGHIVKAGSKFYCAECGDPVVYIPDAPKVTGTMMGAQATLISNSDNRITTNNYYSGGTPEEQVETPYGVCSKNEARFCKQCRRWIPIIYFNVERGMCDNCIEQEGDKAFEDGLNFFDNCLYDEALDEFQKIEPIYGNPEKLAKLQYYMGRCFYEKKLGTDAVKYFIKSLKLSADSNFYMGLCCNEGFGINKDTNKGLSHIKTAANMGSQQAKEFILEFQRKEEERKKAEEERQRREAEKRKQEEEECKRREEEQRKKAEKEKLRREAEKRKQEEKLYEYAERQRREAEQRKQKMLYDEYWERIRCQAEQRKREEEGRKKKEEEQKKKVEEERLHREDEQRKQEEEEQKKIKENDFWAGLRREDEQRKQERKRKEEEKKEKYYDEFWEKHYLLWLGLMFSPTLFIVIGGESVK